MTQSDPSRARRGLDGPPWQFATPPWNKRLDKARPAFYIPANYPLSRTFLPRFISHFLPVSTPATCTSAVPHFTNSSTPVFRRGARGDAVRCFGGTKCGVQTCGPAKV